MTGMMLGVLLASAATTLVTAQTLDVCPTGSDMRNCHRCISGTEVRRPAITSTTSVPPTHAWAGLRYWALVVKIRDYAPPIFGGGKRMCAVQSCQPAAPPPPTHGTLPPAARPPMHGCCSTPTGGRLSVSCGVCRGLPLHTYFRDLAGHLRGLQEPRLPPRGRVPHLVRRLPRVLRPWHRTVSANLPSPSPVRSPLLKARPKISASTNKPKRYALLKPQCFVCSSQPTPSLQLPAALPPPHPWLGTGSTGSASRGARAGRGTAPPTPLP